MKKTGNVCCRSACKADWEEQAIKLKAWQRTRKLARVADLLRALLVYGACGVSFRQLGIWATLLGLGSLSERAWRKRVEHAQEWIAWSASSAHWDAPVAELVAKNDWTDLVGGCQPIEDAGLKRRRCEDA